MTEHDYCYQCYFFITYPGDKYRGSCRKKPGHRRNHNIPACDAFKPLIRCPLCLERSVDPKDGLGICRSCRGEIEVNKRTIYKVKAR